MEKQSVYVYTGIGMTLMSFNNFNHSK